MFSVADTFEQKTGAVLRKRPQYYSDSFQGIEKNSAHGDKDLFPMGGCWLCWAVHFVNGKARCYSVWLILLFQKPQCWDSQHLCKDNHFIICNKTSLAFDLSDRIEFETVAINKRMAGAVFWKSELCLWGGLRFSFRISCLLIVDVSLLIYVDRVEGWSATFSNYQR